MEELLESDNIMLIYIMSAFPPPLNQPPVFNPSLFTSAVTNIIAAVDPNPQAYLEYPTAQGPVNFVSGSNQTTVGAQNLAILTNVGTTDNGIIFGANGLVYNGVTGPLGITWSNLATKIEAIQALSQATNATTLNVNNTIRVQDGETESDPISYINISSGITNAIVSTTDLLLEAPNIDISGQATFQLPPHIPEPILGNDAASKGYVDSLVGQYSGGYNLFFNYSETDATYPTNKVLAKLVSAAAQQTNVITGFTSGTQIVATFITEPFNISEIPAGLWNAVVYGAVSGTGGDVHYLYEIFKVDDLGNETSIAQSGISGDVNASPNSNPTAYFINATLPIPIPLALTDRIRIVLSVTKTGANTISLTTFFESSYYSFVQTSLNAGTNITGSNNVFTGTNAFSLPPTTPLQTGTPANTDIVNYETITTLIGNIPAPTTPSLADVLGVGTDASANNITNVNILQSNAGVNVGSSSGNYLSLLTDQINITNGTTTYPLAHLDKTYLSIDASANQYARLSNIDTPRLSLNTSTKTTELTAQSFYAGNGFGNTGQVLTRRPTDFEYGWEDPAVVYPIVSTLQYFITTDSPFFQYPPAPPTNALLQAYQYYGWYFINSVALRKIDWFFAPDYAMTVADVKGVYLNYLNVTTTSNENLPFFSIYTKPTGVDDIIPGFAHSVATYVANFTPTAATPFCSFMNISGTQPDPFPYGHQLGSMILSPVAPNPRGQYLPTEEVLAISVGTNSTSPVNEVNFIMSKVGICLEQGNQELILNPQNIISPSVPTLGQVMTSGAIASSNLNMSSFSINASSTIFTNTFAPNGVQVTDISNNNKAILTNSTSGSNVNQQGILTNNALLFYTDSTSNKIKYGNNGIQTLNGQTLNITTIAGMNLQNVAPTAGQVITADSGLNPVWATPTSGWVGTATSDLNMSSFLIDASANNLSIGTLTITALTLGKSGNTTNIRGNLQINASSGTSGQVLTSNGTTAEWATPTSGWTGTATSQLNMGIYDISGAVLDNSGNTLAVGGNTTTTTLGKATTGITNLQGVVKINNSAGSSGQVLTSTGASTAPTWQTPTGGTPSLAVVKTNPFLNTNAFAGGSSRSVYMNNFLNITPPTLTATYLIKAQLLCNHQGTNASLFGNLGIQAGGGAQTTAAINAFNGTAMTSNTTFSQSNSLSQCSVNTTSVFGQLSFTYIHTPATLSTLSYALWVGTTGNGAGTIFSMEIIQIIA